MHPARSARTFQAVRGRYLTVRPRAQQPRQAVLTLGGKASKGTPADRRLRENRGAPAKPVKKAAPKTTGSK